MKKIIVTVVIITSLIATGGIYAWQSNDSNNAEKSSKLQIKKLEDRVKTLTTNKESSTAALTSTEIKASENETMDGEVFPVYGMDENVQEKQVNFYIDMPKNITTSEKIKLIASKLSRFKFGNLPMEFVKINVENGKKIAVINLKESEVNQGVTEAEKLQGRNWKSGYFQGSAGGAETSYSLIETCLQKKYTGEWIDGVQFLYENKPINQWQHVEELSKVIYRK